MIGGCFHFRSSWIRVRIRYEMINQCKKNVNIEQNLIISYSLTICYDGIAHVIPLVWYKEGMLRDGIDLGSLD